MNPAAEGARAALVSDARRDERETCIDELLALAARSLDHAADGDEYRDAYLSDARSYYRAAWMLASAIDRDMSWPSPSTWIDWARAAMRRAS
jgi:hypothetical protein